MTSRLIKNNLLGYYNIQELLKETEVIRLFCNKYNYNINIIPSLDIIICISNEFVIISNLDWTNSLSPH